MSIDDTPGLLAKLSRAFKSKDQTLKFEGEPVSEEQVLSEPNADATAEAAEPTEQNVAAAHAMPTLSASGDAAEQAPAEQPANQQHPDLEHQPDFRQPSASEQPAAFEQPALDAPQIVQPRPAHSYRVSANEAREIVLRGLRRLPDFPSQGVEVTLYGSRPWGAMLTFAAGSTSHRNATEFRSRLVEMVHDLRKQIEIDFDRGD